MAMPRCAITAPLLLRLLGAGLGALLGTAPLVGADPLFIWTDGDALNTTAAGEPCSLVAVDRAVTRADSAGFVLDCRDGAAQPDDDAQARIAAALAAGGLSVGWWVESAGDGRLLSLAGGTIVLDLRQDRLVLAGHLPGAGRAEVSAPATLSGRRAALGVRVDRTAGLALSLDGVRLGASAWTAEAAEQAPGTPALRFGGAGADGTCWPGLLAGITVGGPGADPVVPQPPAAGTIPRTVVQARLVEAPEVPGIESLGHYPRAVAEFLYEVVAVESGPAIGPRVAVARWVYLDRRPLALARTVGQVHRLALEPWERHPQMEGEQHWSSLSDLEAPLFLEIGSAPFAAASAR